VLQVDRGMGRIPALTQHAQRRGTQPAAFAIDEAQQHIPRDLTQRGRLCGARGREQVAPLAKGIEAHAPVVRASGQLAQRGFEVLAQWIRLGRRLGQAGQFTHRPLAPHGVAAVQHLVQQFGRRFGKAQLLDPGRFVIEVNQARRHGCFEVEDVLGLRLQPHGIRSWWPHGTGPARWHPSDKAPPFSTP